MTFQATNKRHRFIHDIHRPQYHYLPPANWMNDPNGVIQWDGQYHLFYQYNPNGAYHDNMHWGHAVSSDLIHWEDLPIALEPTANTVDEGGIFSGCVVNHNGTAAAFYTGVNHGHSIQTQCMATSHDGLLTWQKYRNNPLIDTVPKEMGQTQDFRDPFVWHDNDTWYMAVGSRMQGVGGAVLLYRSSDLAKWEYLHPLMVGESARHGLMWECPNFFPLDDKWVLIISSHLLTETSTVLYFVGDYQNHRFIPEYEGVLDYAYYYAPLTLLDDQNRRIVFGWIREGRSANQQLEAGWTGVQAIPRVLSLDAHNHLNMQPVSEFEQLRTNHHQFDSADIGEQALPISGRSLEIHASFISQRYKQCGITLACSPDGVEKTDIIYDNSTQTLHIQRQNADESPEIETGWQGAPHRLEDDEILELLILLDGSVIEIIANQRTSITTRIYPSQSDSQHIYVRNRAALKSLDIWELSSIW